MERLLGLLSFQGRASRLEFWRFQLLMTVVSGVVILLAMLAIQVVGVIAAVLLFPLAVAVVASVAITVRRLHDRNRSGWWYLGYWIAQCALAALRERLPTPLGRGITLPFLVLDLVMLGLSIWLLLELGSFRGTRGLNRYGDDASAPTSAVFG